MFVYLHRRIGSPRGSPQPPQRMKGPCQPDLGGSGEVVGPAAPEPRSKQALRGTNRISERAEFDDLEGELRAPTPRRRPPAPPFHLPGLGTRRTDRPSALDESGRAASWRSRSRQVPIS